MPIFGLPSKIQATVNRMPGMIKGMIESAKNKDLKGVLVRSFSHARNVPSVKAKTDVPIANWRELKNNFNVSQLPYADK